jgi:catechol 2,3-dioxygenase-like lactoylglutathione lyase family enzyme
MPIELLEPWEVERNDFLARFVARHGDGPHHLTFKVSDFDAALARVRAAGFHPVNIDVSDPEWKEAFLMPREAHGTVVQLAESHGHPEGRAELLAHVARNGPNMHPRWWDDPASPEGAPARLRRVVLRTPVLADAAAFFADTLEGVVEREAADRVELAWPRGARVALEERTDADPGVDRLEVEGLHAEQTVIGTRFVPL